MAIGQILPEYVLNYILSLLPVKSLMRFKCVCKSWRLLFENPSFIAKHLNNNDNGESFLFVHYIDTAVMKQVFSLLSNKTLHKIPAANLDFPYLKDVSAYRLDLHFVGYCDGILCLFDSFGLHTLLWNPATREIKFLPKSSLPHPSDMSNMFSYVFYIGFGFDAKTNNYKLINMFRNSNPHTKRSFEQIEVYNLSTDSWSKCDALIPFKDLCESGRPYAYLNGVCSHLAKDESHVEMIVSFDISQEVFIVTPVPDVCGIKTKLNYLRKLTVLNDKQSIALILSVNHNGRHMYDGSEVWMLKEYGIKESWTKLYTFQLSFSQLLRPLGYWKNNHYFMETLSQKMVLWNPVTQQIDDLQIDSVWKSSIFFYKESLVSLNGFSFSEYSRIPRKIPPEFSHLRLDDEYYYESKIGR